VGTMSDRVDRGSSSEVFFDPLDPSFCRNPHSIYTHLRDIDPVHRLDAYGAWVVTRHEDVAALMRSSVVTTDVRKYAGYEAPVDRANMTPTEWFTNDAVLRGDQERQRRLRRLVAKVFSPVAVARLHSEVEGIVENTLPSSPPEGEFDGVSDFALPIPPRVIAHVLGVPLHDVAHFCVLARQFIAITNPVRSLDETQMLDGTIAELRNYIYGLIDERSPSSESNDFLGRLLVQEQEGERLSTDEVVKLCMSLLAAGVETMASLISVGLLTLLTDERLLGTVRRSPDRMPAMVEELLRHQMIGKFIVRFAVEDFALHGREVARGDLILLCPPAAQRDPRCFVDAEAFDIDRDNHESLAFGVGSHYCVGAALARLEATVALSVFVRRFPDARLAAPPEAITWTSELFGRRPTRLPMTVEPVSTS
jgi:cytochrome P450